jgi:hypothetical protein
MSAFQVLERAMQQIRVFSACRLLLAVILLILRLTMKMEALRISKMLVKFCRIALYQRFHLWQLR